MRTGPGFLALSWMLCMAPLAQAADVAVQVVRNGEAFDVEASAELEADPVQAWAALTDYDRLSEFIPGMNESRVVSRDGNNVIVDQSGEARLLFFTFPMRVRLAIVEQAFDRIDSRAIDGNFKELTGTYHIETLEARLLLRYSGSMTPDFAVPPLIGTLLVRNIVTQRFRAMVEEILRRQPEEPDQPLPAQP